MAPRRTTTKAVEPRTLLVTRQCGPVFKITVPGTAKVTLSQGVNPQSKYSDHRGACLRVYEGTKQTAAFSGVAEFRDMSYAYAERGAEISEATVSDSKGNRASKRSVREVEWASDEEWESEEF